ncbi:MAG: ubiquinol-cytochrome c reductase iron-sulfur subunit [Rhodocyclaceae bacterium]|nr:MAG: ubiquinol-cytochrome c reductase iron-sulfur subunit [Rhodocyclaceae bacterium]
MSIKSSDFPKMPQRRRRQLLAAICAAGVTVPGVWYYANRAQAPEGSPTPVPIRDLPPGRLSVIDWQGRTVWVLRRGAAELAMLTEHESELIDPDSLHSVQPDACRNRHRSLRPEIFVAIGLCTHQGCPPNLHLGSGGRGEFLCPCHTSRYDLAGRVYREGPALANLVIPVYRIEGDERVIIGVS